MAYTPDYTEADLTEASIDGIAKFVIVAAGFVGLMVLVFLATWGVKKFRGR